MRVAWCGWHRGCCTGQGSERGNRSRTSTAIPHKELAMKDRNENSVLTSLKDLKVIEEDRLKKEEAAALARAEQERQALKEAERRSQEEQARRLEAQAEATRAAEESRRREEREAAIRLAQAEAAARVEAEARIEAERMRLEHDERPRSSGRPVALLAALLGLMVLLGGGSAYLFAVHLPAQERKREAEERSRLREMEARAEADRRALLGRLAEQEKRLQGAIANAQSDAETRRLRAQLEALKKEQAVAVSTAGAPRGREVRGVRRPVRGTMDAPPMKPDPDVRNSALRGLFGDN